MYWISVVGLVAVIGLAVAAVGPSIVRMSRRSSAVKRRAAEVMNGRTRRSSQEFARAFFPDCQQDCARRVHDILRRLLIVDVARIQPEDRLVADLGLGQVDGLEPEHLSCDCEQRFGVPVLSLFSSQDPTVRQLVECVAEAARERS
jgi:hypothetical protein